MWRHEAGRIDFDGPLSRLWRRGWGFREYAPTLGARGDGHWSVVGVHGRVRVQGDRPERREAWAEAVRLALVAVVEYRLLPGPPCAGPREPADIRPEPLALRPDRIGTKGRHGVVQATRGAVVVRTLL